MMRFHCRIVEVSRAVASSCKAKMMNRRLENTSIKLAYRKVVPYPWKGVANNVKDTHPPREEWGVVISDVAIDTLVTGPLSEERVVFVHR
jgi:hypothetical protein